MYNFNTKNYLAPIPFLVNHYIREYDISKANLNIFYNKGVISKEEYDTIIQFPKYQREVYFGMMQKDPEKSKILSEGLAEFRERFIKENNIKDIDILSVKNDAIYLIDTVPRFTKFDNVEFVLKNEYTSYYNINKLEVYYNYNCITGTETLDIKGIHDDKLVLHANYMIDFLRDVFYSIQTRLSEETLNMIQKFAIDYSNKILPIGYYRELNADSAFRISRADGFQYLCDPIDQSMVPYINIITNYSIISELYSIVSTIYFNKR